VGDIITNEHTLHKADGCFQYGGDLATVNDLTTNEFIISMLNGLWWQNNGVWIGLNDRGREQHWYWSNG